MRFSHKVQLLDEIGENNVSTQQKCKEYGLNVIVKNKTKMQGTWVTDKKNINKNVSLVIAKMHRL